MNPANAERRSMPDQPDLFPILTGSETDAR